MDDAVQSWSKLRKKPVEVTVRGDRLRNFEKSAVLAVQKIHFLLLDSFVVHRSKNNTGRPSFKMEDPLHGFRFDVGRCPAQFSLLNFDKFIDSDLRNKARDAQHEKRLRQQTKISQNLAKTVKHRVTIIQASPL